MERLTEAIEKYKKLSEEKDCLARTFRGFRDYGNPKSTITSGAENNQNLSEEYAQLAEWLEELSQYKELLPTPQMIKDLINMNRKHEKNALENAHIVDDYRQKQEQGLLIELPCKVGDTVYFTDRKYDRENRTFIPFVHHGYVKAIKFSARPTKITIEYEDLNDNHGRCKGHDIHASTIGKGVFLTRSEAEEALGKDGRVRAW